MPCAVDMHLVKKTPKTKKCTLCGRRRKLKEFSKHRQTKDGLDCWCRSCHRDKHKSYYQKDPPKGVARVKKWKKENPELTRASHLRRMYGITIVQYDAMLKAQGGTCAICKKPPKKRRLHVDHDHKTKRIRGLLCWHCNRALGYLRDDKDAIKAAAAYLARKAARGLL